MGCSASKSTATVEVPSLRASKRASADRNVPPAKAARNSAIAAAAEAKAAAERMAASVSIQSHYRGKKGRTVAANTCPPCAAACPTYIVNMNAEVFGACLKCGFGKAGHTEKALLKGSNKALKKRGSAELRSKMMQREMADCKEFRVNMDPSLPFGTCMCGRPRAEHTQAALAAKGGKGTTRANSGELRAKMVQREMADCQAFIVSMDPSLPFGTCRCGRPRAEHTEAALCAETDKNSGKRLVKKDSADVRQMMEAKQAEIGTAVETQGAKTVVAFGIGNTTRTAAEEQAAVQAAINARAGGVDKAAALHDFNEMMKKEAGAPAA